MLAQIYDNIQYIST